MTVLISQYTVYLFGVVIVALSVWTPLVRGPEPTDCSGHGLDEQGFGPLRWHRLPSQCWAWR